MIKMPLEETESILIIQKLGWNEIFCALSIWSWSYQTYIKKKKKKIEERRLEIPNLKQGKKKPDPQI